MKIKLDENLPDELRAILSAYGHDVHSVPEEFLTGQDDQTVFTATRKEQRILLTQDLDFSDVRQSSPVRIPASFCCAFITPAVEA